ncbi:MAG: DUF2712 domain-containing protein [Clostridium sp.]
MKSRKVVSKILTAAMICMSVSSLGMMVAEGAGNITDRQFGFNYHDASLQPVAVGSEAKWDYTSCYIYNRDSYQDIKVDVWATNRTGSSYTLQENCNSDGTKTVRKGYEMYLPNYVKERGYGSCTLLIRPAGNYSTYIGGLWSPDSI